MGAKPVTAEASGSETGQGRELRRPLVVACAGLFLAVAICGEASAAVIHDFLPAPSRTVSAGVPRGQAAIPGPVSSVKAMTVDAGRLWLADRLNSGPALGRTRVDEFEAESGRFVTPQLDEEGGVTHLEAGVAVAHFGAETLVYLPAGSAGVPAVAVYDGTSGKLKDVWSGAVTAGKGFGTLQGIAVDSSPNIATKGDIYVAAFSGEPSRNVVDVFKSEGGGGEPVSVAAPAIAGTCPVAGTTCVGKEVRFTGPSGVAVSSLDGRVLVTDAHRTIDVFEPTGVNEYKFVRTLTGTPTGPGGSTVPFGAITSVAVDGSTGSNGDIYIADESTRSVYQLGPEGEYRGRLVDTPAGPFINPQTVAVDSATANVFVGDFDSGLNKGSIDVFGPTAVIPDVTTAAASGVAVSAAGEIEATLNGTVNPLGAGAASCSFSWGTGEAFGQPRAPCEPEGVASGNTPVAVVARVAHLAPDTRYSFRLTAINSNGENAGEAAQDQRFTTPGPGLDDSSVADVAATSATLQASVNPHKASTRSYFEYGKTSAYEGQLPLAPGTSLGSDEGDVAFSEHLQGLAPGTAYHYRLVAVSELKIGGIFTAVTFRGPDRAFRTEGSATIMLPDARRWELVSPADKHGALPLPISEQGISQSAPSGNVLTYLVNVPTEPGVRGYSEEVQVLSRREPSGWSAQDISLPHSAAVGASAGHGNDYRAFSEDLTQGLAEPLGQFTSLAPEVFPPDTERTPYLRHNSTCSVAPATCFEPLVTGASGYADVPPGTEFGGGSIVGELHGQANYLGATPDISHVILTSHLPLTGQSTNNRAQLYEWSAASPAPARLRLVSELPNNTGAVSAANAKLGSGEASEATRHAISDDGTRVFWSEFEGGGHLYMRDTELEQTLQLDAPQTACLEAEECGGGEATPSFQVASSDGARVFFTDEQRLTSDSGAVPGRPDLYACRITVSAGRPSCTLTNLTPVNAEHGADVVGGALGASEDGALIYFVARGVLAANRNAQGQTAVAGEVNLYSRQLDAASETWKPAQFITTLSSEDAPDWSLALAARGQTSRVSPDGHWLTFMSNRSLTGFDNRDVNSGKPDEEVYLFHIDDGALACVSCNRAGGRPLGAEYQELLFVAGNSIWPPSAWIAANIPAWTPYTLTIARYQSRYLSNSGRLFFNSRDALVPQDLNGNEDVYQYEPTGVGDCTGASPTFNAAIGGCTSLISSGAAAGESAFLDASETGNDVFFLTAGRLSPADTDTSVDVYDAHVCSEAAPCPNPPEAVPPCTSADSCRAAPTPPPSVFDTPPSTTVSGSGNLPPQSPHDPPPAAPHHPSKLAKALASCRKKYARSKRKRIACERRARKAYGARHASNRIGR